MKLSNNLIGGDLEIQSQKICCPHDITILYKICVIHINCQYILLFLILNHC